MKKVLYLLAFSVSLISCNVNEPTDMAVTPVTETDEQESVIISHTETTTNEVSHEIGITIRRVLLENTTFDYASSPEDDSLYQGVRFRYEVYDSTEARINRAEFRYPTSKAAKNFSNVQTDSASYIGKVRSDQPYSWMAYYPRTSDNNTLGGPWSCDFVIGILRPGPNEDWTYQDVQSHRQQTVRVTLRDGTAHEFIFINPDFVNPTPPAQ